MRLLTRCFVYACGVILGVLALSAAIGALEFFTEGFIKIAGLDPKHHALIFAPLCFALILLAGGTIGSYKAIGNWKRFRRHVAANTAEFLLIIVGLVVLVCIGGTAYYILSKFLFEEIAFLLQLHQGGFLWSLLVYIIPGAICVAAFGKAADFLARIVLEPLQRWKNKA